jgi:hypothetical protein
MIVKLLPAIALLAITPALAQEQDTKMPKASKAEVESLVGSLKNDKAKMAQFCELQKLYTQYNAVGDKDDKKLEELDKAEEEAEKKLGPDFERITSSEIDDESAKLLHGLADTCPK